MRSLLKRLVDVRDDEMRALFWSCAYFFFVLSSYYLLRPVRETVGVAGGVENLPWLFTGTLAGMVLVHPLFAGAVPREDLAGFYAAADLLVWPAVNEAYGMALLEAQATGLPVIAGDTGGVPDVVHHGETGLLCPVGDAAMFSDALKMLLEAPDLRDDFSRNALDRTAAENDISAAAEALNRILQGSRKARAA